MKIMIFKTRVEHLENVLNEIGNSNLYEYPHVDFVLVKEINGKDYYTAGISLVDSGQSTSSKPANNFSA